MDDPGERPGTLAAAPSGDLPALAPHAQYERLVLVTALRLAATC